MIPNITRGTRVVGLMTYLVKEGRANEHTEQHLVAGDHAIMARHGYAVLDVAAAREIGIALDTPRLAYGVDVTRQARIEDPQTGELHTERVPADVWHCSLSLHADEGQLSDEQWGTIAQQFVDRMGFTEESGKAACRWVAVRHGLSKNGNDHVHIAVSLVRALKRRRSLSLQRESSAEKTAEISKFEEQDHHRRDWCTGGPRPRRNAFS